MLVFFFILLVKMGSKPVPKSPVQLPASGDRRSLPTSAAAFLTNDLGRCLNPFLARRIISFSPTNCYTPPRDVPDRGVPLVHVLREFGTKPNNLLINSRLQSFASRGRSSPVAHNSLPAEVSGDNCINQGPEGRDLCGPL
jgi:hypothetical protein